MTLTHAQARIKLSRSALRHSDSCSMHAGACMHAVLHDAPRARRGRDARDAARPSNHQKWAGSSAARGSSCCGRRATRCRTHGTGGDTTRTTTPATTSRFLTSSSAASSTTSGCSSSRFVSGQPQPAGLHAVQRVVTALQPAQQRPIPEGYNPIDVAFPGMDFNGLTNGAVNGFSNSRNSLLCAVR